MTLLAEGLADQLATDLGRISRLQVNSPASVRFALSQGARDPRRIGRALSARWLLDGQLLPGRQAVRVNVQLIDAAAGTMRWSASMQRPTTDLLGLIQQITDSVATGIIGQLAPDERARLLDRPTSNGQAYEMYLRGRASLTEGLGASLLLARTLFEQAVRLDTAFAAAHAALASTWVSIADNIMAPRASYPRAREYAIRALRLDSANGEAIAAMAKIAVWYDWDVAGGLLLARRATALAPRSAEAHLILGYALLLRGDTALAAAALHEALDLDSLSTRTLANVINGLVFAGRQDDLLARSRRYREAGLPAWADHLVLDALELTGDCAGAAAIRMANDSLGATHWNRCRGWSVAQVDSAVAVGRAERPYFRAAWFVPLYLEAGQTDRAMALLEQAFQDREGLMPFIQLSPQFRPLYGDPRFLDLVRRVRVAAGQP